VTRRTVALVALTSLAGCERWDLNRMQDQPRCDPYEPTPLLPGGTCDQPLPAGVVAWTGARAEVTAPPPLTRALVERGRDRFDRYCATCHGFAADGSSQVAENMVVRPPPSLVAPPVPNMTDLRIFNVITDGYGLMPAYADALVPADRWAIVHYVRALQRASGAALDELPTFLQEEARTWLR
jgi:mono/diheme cytochrome c family protein